MPYIYKITNLINGKQYVGKTLKTIEQRWQEHIQDSGKEKIQKRPLYSAIKKYGIENFIIEEIEKVDVDNINEREKYWIKFLNTFKNGYNATIGGDGKSYIDYDLVVKTYKQVQNAVETAKILDIHRDSVVNILKAKEIPIVSSQEISSKRGKPVGMYDKQTGKLIKTFSNSFDAGRYIISNNLSQANLKSVRYHIAEVCRNRRKSIYGFVWKFI